MGRLKIQTPKSALAECIFNLAKAQQHYINNIPAAKAASN